MKKKSVWMIVLGVLAGIAAITGAVLAVVFFTAGGDDDSSPASQSGGTNGKEARTGSSPVTPTTSPSLRPSERPSTSPTLTPSASPSVSPTMVPTTSPTEAATDLPTPEPTPPQPFRLKLYWQYGYFWQEEPFEREWCLECQGGSCGQGDLVWLEECNDDPKQLFLELDLGNGFSQIKVYNKNLCVDRTGIRSLTLEVCNSSRTRQQWDFFYTSDVRFEIHPASVAGCVSQHHHPKAEELVYVETCDEARQYDTSYWNKF